MSTIEQDMSSIGHMASVLQRHPSSLRKLAEQLGIRPSLRLNDVAYYSATDIERIGEYLRQTVLEQTPPMT